MRRKTLLWIAAPAIALIVLGLAALQGLADFDISTRTSQNVAFQSGPNTLAGTLLLPEAPNPSVAIFVHGDGPQTRFSDDGYLPLISTLLDAGIGVFTWDKPGTGESTGNWLDQSMEARTAEAEAAYQAIRAKGHLTGFLGFSQAGWVVPEAAYRTRPAFSILIGPALNWRDQGAYYQKRRLEAEGLPPEDVARQIARTRARNDVAFAENAISSPPGMSPQRHHFVQRAYTADASDALKAMPGPVLALWGAEDLNVDPLKNANAYRRLLPGAHAPAVIILP